MAKEGKSKTESSLDSVEKPEETVEPLKPTFNKPAIICVGEYPIKILLGGSLAEKQDEPLPIFIDKSSEDISGWGRSTLNPGSILGLDLNIDTHFWFQVFQ